MKIKTNELTGIALDWAVAKCKPEGMEFRPGYRGEPLLVDEHDFGHVFAPSTDWAQGGPILTCEHISRTIDHSGLWIAYRTDGYTEGDEGKKWMQCDRSELVAGLRCYVASELGDEVDVPEELI